MRKFDYYLKISASMAEGESPSSQGSFQCKCGNIILTGRCLSDSESPQLPYSDLKMIYSPNIKILKCSPSGISAKSLIQTKIRVRGRNSYDIICPFCKSSFRVVTSNEAAFSCFLEDAPAQTRNKFSQAKNPLSIKNFFPLPLQPFMVQMKEPQVAANILLHYPNYDSECYVDQNEDWSQMFSNQDEIIIGSYTPDYINGDF